VTSFSIIDFRTNIRDVFARQASKNAPASPPRGPIMGQVKAVGQKAITITTPTPPLSWPKGTDLPIYTTGATAIHRAVPGSYADITPGSKILVQGTPANAGINAAGGEVIVLPPETRFEAAASPILGQVKAVDQNAITITTPDGTDLSIYTTDATVIHKEVAGTSADITLGSKILVQGTLTFFGINANKGAVMVLPSGTRFAAA
jgi:hypothetical protein